MKEQWVLFALAGQRYCTDAAQIKEVITYRPANPIPGAPSGVEGIITVRKDKITLFSGAKLIAKKDAAAKESGHIILLESGNDIFGVTVDGVDGIIQLDPDLIDPSSVSEDHAVLGTVPHEGQLITAVSLITFCENAVADQKLDQ
jgi:purine-binding chemotaxis protein CheW